jgi:hypothetical protein
LVLFRDIALSSRSSLEVHARRFLLLAPYDSFPSHSSSDNPIKVDPLRLKGPLEKLGQRYYAFTTRGSTKLISVKEITDKNFGLIIAFLLPGFLLLWFLALSDNDNSEIGPWLKSFSDPSVSGFLYVILASLALGLIISAVRWAVVDHLLGWCFRPYGKPWPEIDFSKLREPDKFAAFQRRERKSLPLLSILLEYSGGDCCGRYDLSR